ncbi:MAG TPA: hypothetical protein VIH63_10780, partial [Xanthobacteraceae bacterium]
PSVSHAGTAGSLLTAKSSSAPTLCCDRLRKIGSAWKFIDFVMDALKFKVQPLLSKRVKIIEP